MGCGHAWIFCLSCVFSFTEDRTSSSERDPSMKRTSIHFSNCLAVLLFLFVPAFGAKQISINIDCNEDLGKLNRFWRQAGNKGGAPHKNTAEQAMIMYMGGIPRNGYEFYHPQQWFHQNGISGSETNIDFTELDKAFDFCLKNGIRPCLSFHFNFDLDFSSQSNRDRHRAAITSIVNHYKDRYGIEEIRKWIFQYGNEADIRSPNHILKFQIEEDAVHDIDSQLLYGGPGRSGGDSNGGIAWLLRHAHDSLNTITGEMGTRIDFIDWHTKGPHWKVVREAEAIVNFINTNTPDFTDKILLVDDESDPIAGHGTQLSWRAMPSYPAMIACRVWAAITHVELAGVGKYLTMSQDNAFRHETGWLQRTLFTDFQNEAYYVKKSSVLIYEALGLLADTMIGVSGYTSPPLPNTMASDISPSENVARVEAIATKDGDGRVAILVFNNREFYIESTPDDAAVSLTVDNLSFGEGVMVHYRLGEYHSNPFRTWQEMGGAWPEFTGEIYSYGVDGNTLTPYQGPLAPTLEQLEQMRDRSQLERYEPPKQISVSGGSYSLEFDLPCPAVSLIILTPKPSTGPLPPPGEPWTQSIERDNQIMVGWKDSPTKQILTYEVLYSETQDGTYERINNADMISTSYLHMKQSGSPDGHYKVRAIDYWGRTSDGQQVENVLLARMSGPAAPFDCRNTGNRLTIVNRTHQSIN
ncbi:MAG: hypothetical protein GF350_07635, partial [Chitinivibrionales bacterium]|nr:hypothetical protein [Chitinivibrionales bacterium]